MPGFVRDDFHFALGDALDGAVRENRLLLAIFGYVLLGPIAEPGNIICESLLYLFVPVEVVELNLAVRKSVNLRLLVFGENYISAIRQSGLSRFCIREIVNNRIIR